MNSAKSPNHFADAPPLDLNSAQLATLIRVMQGEALCLVNKFRLEQITRFGHSDEADNMEPVDYLPKLARNEINAVLEDLMMPRDIGIPLAYKHLAKAAAMLLAGMDRIAPQMAELQRRHPVTQDLFAQDDAA